jgi:hypothetical protein
MFLTSHFNFLLLLFMDLAIQLINHVSLLLFHDHHPLILCLHPNIKRWRGRWTFSELAFHDVAEKLSVLFFHLSPLFHLFSAFSLFFFLGLSYLPVGNKRIILILVFESHLLAVALADLIIKLLSAL